MSDPQTILRVQIEPIEVRAMAIRIDLVSGLFGVSDFNQALPETVSAKYPAFQAGSAIEFQQVLRVRAGTFKYRQSTLVSLEWARRIGVRKSRQRSGQLPVVRIKPRPQVAVEVIDDCPGMENLPDACRIFACNAQNHVEEFVQTKRLSHHRPHGNISGFFFRVTDRNRFRQRHDGSIRGERLKSRYEN